MLLPSEVTFNLYVLQHGNTPYINAKGQASTSVELKAYRQLKLSA